MAGLGVSGYIFLQVGLSVTGEPLAVSLYGLPHLVWSESDEFLWLKRSVMYHNSAFNRLFTEGFSVLVQTRMSRIQVSTFHFLSMLIYTFLLTLISIGLMVECGPSYTSESLLCLFCRVLQPQQALIQRHHHYCYLPHMHSRARTG